MTSPTAPGTVNFKGLPCILLQRPAGDRALIALHGAQVLSWVSADGREHLYLSPRAQLDGQGAIRGGIPLCFPQFNQRVIEGRKLPKHGFARLLHWQVLEQTPGPAGRDQAVLRLTPAQLTPALRQAWPFDFEARVSVTLTARQLDVAFELVNTGDQPLPFALALHTYLRVGDIGQTRLEGLQGAGYWDAVAHPQNPAHIEQERQPGLTIEGEFDRVYRSAAATTLRQPDHALALSQGAELTETVVWNPGAALCAGLADMPADGYRHMLCVEAARIDAPVWLAPGACWQAGQTLQTL